MEAWFQRAYTILGLNIGIPVMDFVGLWRRGWHVIMHLTVSNIVLPPV